MTVAFLGTVAAHSPMRRSRCKSRHSRPSGRRIAQVVSLPSCMKQSRPPGRVGFPSQSNTRTIRHGSYTALLYDKPNVLTVARNGCVGGNALCSAIVPHLFKVPDNYETSVKCVMTGKGISGNTLCSDL
jgi:hypothetical protein